MNILFVLLGCNIYSILLNRLETSFKFIEENIKYTSNINTPNINTNIDYNSKIVLNYNNSNIYGTNFYKKVKYHITWFLSGGIKNNFVGAKSEANIMKSQIDNLINSKYNSNDDYSKKYNFSNNDLTCIPKFDWNYILDEKSTNTVENFISVSQFLNTTNQLFDSIYIITSKFHYDRANMILNLIDPSKNFKWILGDLEEKDSRYWESIHINNVYSDVFKAKMSNYIN